MSSLVYAATRCGQFPELQELRTVFTSRFGKEFVTCAIQLRNNCRVNPTVGIYQPDIQALHSCGLMKNGKNKEYNSCLCNLCGCKCR